MVPEIKAAILRVKTEAGVALDACQAIEGQPQDDTAIVSEALGCGTKRAVGFLGCYNGGAPRMGHGVVENHVSRANPKKGVAGIKCVMGRGVYDGACTLGPQVHCKVFS